MVVRARLVIDGVDAEGVEVAFEIELLDGGEAVVRAARRGARPGSGRRRRR
ncbi:hypothetical protein LUX33_36785 [Actinomadura madurae]|uniref:hypothetical protein n=1 Tax=Actinomadura madurae TaxID=1993 RepID=UPI0020D20EA2|nr:hypothetical protein [Actinomadura madurae]MCP9953447.1 hypothetical protein [Actinomadura madurae]